MDVPYIVIELSGDPESRGRTYGREARAKILRSIENYKDLFMARAGVSWEKAKEISRQFIPFVETSFPDGLREIRGIAEGSGLDFEDILTLNCRSEILYAIPDGCSAIGCNPEDTADGHTLLAQNWDWMGYSADTIVVLRIHQDPLPSMVICTEAGIIGGKGFNDAGIGVTLNALSVGKGRVGVPLHIMYRAILNKRNISHSFDAVTQVQRAGCGCFNVGSAEGFVASVEFSADKVDILMPVGETLCHTNHYLSPLFAGEDLKFRNSHTDSILRLNVLKRRSLPLMGKFDIAAVERILQDHANYPRSVCKHADPVTPAKDRSITVYAVIMDLTARKMLFYPGNTCEVKPVELEI